MEPTYPMTREQLRNYDAIYKEQLKQAFINKGIEYISTQILYKARTPKGQPYINHHVPYPSNIAYETTCEFTIDEVIEYCYSRGNGISGIHSICHTGPLSQYFVNMLEGVKQRFPDCVFTQDPAKKYLFVEW